MWETLERYYDESREYFEDNTPMGDLFAMKYIGMAKAILNNMPFAEKSEKLTKWLVIRDTLNEMQECVLNRRNY